MGGDEAVEYLLFTAEHSCWVAQYLDFETGPEMFNNQESILKDTALDNGENQTLNIDEDDRDMEHFDEEIQAFHLCYCDNCARDTMFFYVSQLVKAHNTDTRDHADRMETLYCYSIKLSGTQHAMNNSQTKEAIFCIIQRKMATFLYLKCTGPSKWLIIRCITIYGKQKIIYQYRWREKQKEKKTQPSQPKQKKQPK